VIDPDRFAALLSNWCLEVREGEQVLVSASTLAEPLVIALHRAILARGAWPLMRLSPPPLERQFYAVAHDAQLDGFAPLELTEVDSVDARVHVRAPANLRELTDIDPAIVARAARARAPIAEARLRTRWCVTLWPTSGLAQQAGMSDEDYAAFLNRALFLDRADPAGAWRELGERQQRLVERLASGREIRIEADGTDLRLRVDGRTWINSDAHSNMPSGEVFTGPVEDSATGTVRFTVPSASRGALVEDVRLRFEAGRVVEARAGRGDSYLQAALETDAGARFLGELGIGTNGAIDRPTGSTLLDEKIAGTIHLALGRSYQETGGVNSSALHWDLICDLRSGGRISVDGEPLDLGTFLVR
jgi:aminopeptidase